MSEFYFVESDTSHVYKVKGSKFIGQIFKIKNEEEAENRLNQIKKKYHDATHNCFAYRTGDRTNEKFRFSDDGEPGGTAGKPIYSVIEGHNLTDILVIVTRYFGGTKLGTGGLIRAYSTAANEALKKTKVIKLIPKKTVKFTVPHNCINQIHHIVEQINAKITDTIFTEKVTFIIEIKEDDEEDFRVLVLDKSSGQAEFHS